MKNKASLVSVIFVMTLTCILSVSCVNHIQDDITSSQPENIPIRISSKILCIKTRMTDNKFEKDDAVGLYVLVQPATLEEERYVDNMRFSCTSSEFVPDKEIYYPQGANKCDFISYYPYQVTGIPVGTSSIQLSTLTDQSSAANYYTSDFMTSVVTDIVPRKSAIKLNYAHKLCQLNIIIKPVGGEDLTKLKDSDPKVYIKDVYTQASYNFKTDELSELSNPQDITPNGEWSISEDLLIGKRAILIPQNIATEHYILALRVDGKSYSCTLPDNFELESNKSCDLTILYDSKSEINGIEANIGDWEEGSKGETTPKEEEEGNAIFVSDLNFEHTSVYNIKYQGITVAEICKEYLLADNINKQAIVIYPTATNGKSDWSNGTVLQLLDEKENIHGGKVSWDAITHLLTYTSGTSAPITTFYIDSDKSIVFTQPENPLFITINKDQLIDIRGKESIVYPIVKIGTQYWTREDMRATMYNDGKTIPLKTDTKETTAGYFKHYSYSFYNTAAMLTGKLDPEGWAVANSEAWAKLKNYIKGDASVIKGSALWTTSEYATNNLTGFNATATGIVNPIYDYYKEYTGYWNMENLNTIAEYCIVLKYNTNEIHDAKHTEKTAYLIRCVRK